MRTEGMDRTARGSRQHGANRDTPISSLIIKPAKSLNGMERFAKSLAYFYCRERLSGDEALT